MHFHAQSGAEWGSELPLRDLLQFGISVAWAVSGQPLTHSETFKRDPHTVAPMGHKIAGAQRLQVDTSSGFLCSLNQQQQQKHMLGRQERGTQGPHREKPPVEQF